MVRKKTKADPKKRYVYYMTERKHHLAIVGGVGSFTRFINRAMKPFIERGWQRELEKSRMSHDKSIFRIDGVE
jgi:predicted alpha/beta superfamily hydrolase